ncbi:LysM peptidoglycan-binding domain-containing protein [Teredinibacter haidensis]|uniref:LysM peptidoglycan-binding domain-containing protein n=1 Tax=Teredinibacter haidensis TaxID=2731755 RepID=UPI00094907BA|nr:LysM peptidoglycan-binding domain-containing protein [Teredinibacter haidensis]
MADGDVKHTVSTGETLSQIAKRYRLTLGRLLSANTLYRTHPEDLRAGADLIIPQAKIEFSALRFERDDTADSSIYNSSETLALPHDESVYFSVGCGQLTFDCEGSEERGRNFSRKPRVPTAESGVTIGRGYDLKERSETEIFDDLMEVGVKAQDARKLSGCRHLSGVKARRFLKDFGFNRIEISAESQYGLFNLLMSEFEGDIINICHKEDIVEKYGLTPWQDIPQVIKDVILDLKFKREFTGATRERLQPALVSGRLDEFFQIMSDRYYWVELRGVPSSRFQKRIDYLSGFVASWMRVDPAI